MDLDRLSLRCPNCGEKIYRQRGGEWSIVAKILKFEAGGQVTAVCEKCRAPLAVPWLSVALPAELEAAEPTEPRARAVVRRRAVDKPTDPG